MYLINTLVHESPSGKDLFKCPLFWKTIIKLTFLQLNWPENQWSRLSAFLMYLLKRIFFHLFSHSSQHTTSMELVLLTPFCLKQAQKPLWKLKYISKYKYIFQCICVFSSWNCISRSRYKNCVYVNLEFQELVSEGHILVKHRSSKKFKLVQPSGSRIGSTKFHFKNLLMAISPFIKAPEVAISMPVSPTAIGKWS